MVMEGVFEQCISMGEMKVNYHDSTHLVSLRVKYCN